MASETRADSADTPSPSAGERKLIGLVETDRYCEECGFNLRGQHVFRDDATRLVLVRCSECGRLHPANLLTTNARGAWFRRLAGFLLFGWVLFLLWFLLVSGVIEVAVQIATSELLDLNKPSSDAYELASRNAMELGWYGFVSFAVPALGLGLMTVAAHHWKRWGYIALAILLPIVPAILVHEVSRFNFPDTAHRMAPFFKAHTAIQMLGGLCGVFLGRPFARLLATLFIPPRTRQALSYLWLADGKPPPALKREGEGAAH